MSRMAKITAAIVVLAIASMANPALADQKIKTKSNIKNDRVIAAAPAGATGCATGSETFTWTVGDQAPKEQVRSSGPPANRAPDPAVCAGAQKAMAQLNASGVSLGQLQAAVDSCDEAALRKLMTDNGLSPELAAGAQFHAINTKGTGCNNGRVSGLASRATAGLVITVGYDARTKRGYSLANWMYFHAK